MTDVIFAGAAGRRPLNSAETVLIFDNTARELSLAADEVRIGRRVYRSGESEYLINGEVCRLRDIRELFSGTGAATEAYSVIEQGRVDKLLIASGKERRGVFEEAAGITRFRTRRAEALRRLERTEQNRQRLADIVGEVASRLETVLRQAARAKRWKILSERLKRCRLAAAAQDLKGVDEELVRLEQQRHQIASAHDQAQTSMAAFDARVQEAAAQVEALDAALDSSEEKVAEARQKVAAADAVLEQLDSRRRELSDDLTKAEQRLAAKVREEQAAAAALRRAEEQASEAREAFQALEARLAELRTTADGSLASADSAREASNRLQEAVTASHRKQLEESMELERVARLAQAAEQQAHECRQRLDRITAARAHLAESLAASEGNVAALEDHIRKQAAEVASLEQRESDLSDIVRNTWDTISELRSQLEAGRERERVLAELSQHQQGVPAGVRAVLTGQLPSPAGLSGILADAIRADHATAGLVDLALGQLGGRLIIDDFSEAVRWAVDWLSGEPDRCGALGFISVNPAAASRSRPDFLGRPGVVNRLDRLVTFDARHGPLIEQVLGDCWVVETLADAWDLLPDAAPNTCLLTRDGMLLSPQGTLEVGGKSMAGLVSRHSEQSSLEDRHRRLNAQVVHHQAELARQEQERTRIRETIRAIRVRMEHTQGELATSRAERQRILREQSASSNDVTKAETARAAAEREAAHLIEEKTRRASEVEAAAAEEQRLTEQLAAARRTIADFDRSRGSLLDEIHQNNQQLELARTRVSDTRAEARRLETARHAGRSACSEEHERLRDVSRRSSLLNLECLRVRQAHAEAAIEAERVALDRRNLHRQKESCLADSREAAAAARRVQSSLAGLERQGHSTELALGEARHGRSRIVERIREDYDLDLDLKPDLRTAAMSAAAGNAPSSEPAEAIPDSRDELEEEIENLRRKIGSFSTVNLEALAEAEELEKRHAELEAQLTDVTQAKASIEQMITRIDEESRRLLGDTIETVRGYFRELFERLFAGGQADIVIDPSEDLLDASVEIVARPPGKEPRNISLLSGGEKTMTCVALLLAIFKSRPSPFCVLDEVDAPLDEANVDRFTSVLKESLSSTQFIVVTHSKKTMAAATTLYGITQEQSGVSKRVSVRFEEAVATASKAA